MREGAKAGECLAASIAPDSDPRNVIEAFKTFKQETGAKERKGAPMALHLMCVVSRSGSSRQAICMIAKTHEICS